jgi:hypothetical protein
LAQYPNSHIIGELRYIKDEGYNKLTALARYDVSVSVMHVPSSLPEIDVYFVGDARSIKCRFKGCKNIQRWEIGKARLLQLMKRYGVETMEQMYNSK